jgi:hypothetical protein
MIIKETYCSGHIQEVLCLLQLSSPQWAYVGPTCRAKLFHPLPLPPVSMSLDQGHQGSGGRGWGCCWSSPDTYALARFSHGSDPSDMTICLSQLTDHPSSWGNTPASAPESEIVLASNNGAGGMERGGGTRESMLG